MFTRCLVVLTLSACADAQTPTDRPAPTAPVDPTVVADGRDIDGTDEGADTAMWEAVPAVQSAVQSARTHWTQQDPGYEEEVRVLDVAEGAFTRPGASEHAVLYLMGLWPRCCPKIGLAIVEEAPGSEARLVRNVAFEGSVQNVRAVPDLNGDGLSELALLGQFGMGGYTSGSATLVAFGRDGLTAQGTVGTYEGGCAAGQEDETAIRIFATPGDRPTFMSETYTRTGCEDGPWTLTSGPDSVSIEPPSQDQYMDLPVE